MQKINEILQNIRKEKALSRKAIENISGFKERTIGSYERGERKPTSEYIRFISLYCGITKECLLNGDISGKNAKCNIPELRFILEVYKAINNVNDEKELNIGGAYFLDSKRLSIEDLEKIYKLCEKLKIKPSSFGFVFSGEETEHKMYDGIDIFVYKLTKNEERREEYKELEKREKEVFKKLKKLESDSNLIFYSFDYYCEILKKRNDPKEIFTPNSPVAIDSKYQEIVELLEYVPDSFIEKLTISLKKIKKEQVRILK